MMAHIDPVCGMQVNHRMRPADRRTEGRPFISVQRTAKNCSTRIRTLRALGGARAVS